MAGEAGLTPGSGGGRSAPTEPALPFTQVEVSLRPAPDLAVSVSSDREGEFWMIEHQSPRPPLAVTDVAGQVLPLGSPPRWLAISARPEEGWEGAEVLVRTPDGREITGASTEKVWLAVVPLDAAYNPSDSLLVFDAGTRQRSMHVADVEGIGSSR